MAKPLPVISGRQARRAFERAAGASTGNAAATWSWQRKTSWLICPCRTTENWTVACFGAWSEMPEWRWNNSLPFC